MDFTVSMPTEGERDPSPDYAVQDIDHLGLAAGMVDELGLVELIDAWVPQDHGQRNLSVGLLVKAMILNGLGFIQRVLYLMPRLFQDKPMDRLLGPGVLAEPLNNDALGRALDAIHRYGPTELFAPLAAQAVKRLGLACPDGTPGRDQPAHRRPTRRRGGSGRGRPPHPRLQPRPPP